MSLHKVCKGFAWGFVYGCVHSGMYLVWGGSRKQGENQYESDWVNVLQEWSLVWF